MGPRERFPETSWTLLVRAREQGDEGARAREEFAQRYYKPIQEFLLVIIRDADLTQELAQEFFARLSRQGSLFEHAHREQGPFRAYLMTALRNLVIDYHRRNDCQEANQTHPDQWSGKGWDTLDLPVFRTAEAGFHRAWVKATLEEALTQVRKICFKRGQQIHLDLFEARYRSETNTVPSWEELGTRYGMDQKTARTRADTVARHFRFVLRRMLRQEVTGPGGGGGRRTQVTEAEIDREIEALLAPLED